VQWASNNFYNPTPAPSTSPSTAPITVAFNAQPVAGHTLIVAFWNNGQLGTGNPITYTPPAGWTKVDLNEPTGVLYATYEAFSHVVAPSETNSYVFTADAGSQETAWVAADVQNASGVDAFESTWISNTTGVFTEPPLAPTHLNDLAIAFNLPLPLYTPVTWTDPASLWTSAGASVVTQTAPYNGEALYQSKLSMSAISEQSTAAQTGAPPGTFYYGFSALVLLKPNPPAATTHQAVYHVKPR
jgi:hypothetical protein